VRASSLLSANAVHWLDSAIGFGLMVLLLGIVGAFMADDPAWQRLFDNLHWTGGTSAAALIAWRGVLTGSRGEIRGRRWMALGLSGYALGQLIWDAQVLLDYREFPSPSDLFYLTLGPLLTFGLGCELFQRACEVERKTVLLDSVTLSLAVLTLVLTLYLPLRGELDLLSLVVLVAYPVGLLSALVVALLLVLALRAKPHWSLLLLQGSMLTTGLCWMGWNLDALGGITSNGTLLNSLFSLSVVGIALAVSRLHLEPTDKRMLEVGYATLWRVLPLLTVLLAVLALYLAHTTLTLPSIAIATIRLGALAVIVLAVFRQGVLLNEHDLLKRASQALEVSEQQKRQILDTLPAMIWLKDTEGRYLMCNPMFERFFGAEEAQIRGRTDYDFVDRELADFFRANDRQAIHAGRPTSNEQWVTFADDGHRALLQATKTPLYDGAGQVMGVLGISFDITPLRHAEQAVKESETRLRRLSDNLPAGFVYQYGLVDGKPRFFYVSAGVESMLGPSPAEVMEDPFQLLGLIDQTQMAAYAQAEALSRAQMSDFSMELRTRHRESGQWHWVLLRSRPRRLDDQTVVWDGLTLDITQQKDDSARLMLAARVFSDAHEAIFICDADGLIEEVNPTFTEITGYGRDEVIGRNPRLLKSQRHGPEFYRELWRSLREDGGWKGNIWNRRKSGEVYAERLTISVVSDPQGGPLHYIGLFSDITDSLLHQEKLEHMAHHDALTELPNRVLLADRLHQAMAQSQRSRHSIAVLYLDLDGFKAINDAYGHPVGDRLLIHVAQQIRQVIREGDTLARLGGDEFVTVLVDLNTPARGIPLIERVLEAAAQVLVVDGKALHVSVSAGVTYYPHPQETTVDADQLLRQADQTMYQAKLTGKNGYHVFDATAHACSTTSLG
jgi:diguanylate cyclase (GGDEF)-like protein/PAS domain S-box-containing protein